MTTEPRPIVLVLMGGPDAERDVSLVSGRAVADALRRSGRFEVNEQTIDRPSAREIRYMRGDVIFPVLHGHWGEGGPLQEQLEIVGLPYVGSRPLPSRLAMDKLATKAIAASENIPTPEAAELLPVDTCPVAAPVVIKPVDDGSSVVLRICRTGAEITAARDDLHPVRPRLMAEAYIRGRELTVGILDDAPLPLIEIVPAVDFYDYDAKYEREDTQYIIDPELPDGVADVCTERSLRLFRRLGCRDIARVDFMFDGEQSWLLEINTMPGFTPHSLVPMAAAHAGRDLPTVCAELVQAAMARSPRTALRH
jgi:D-alanine-D-alanine ligase